MYMHKLSASQLNRPTPEEFIRMPRRPLYVILDNVRSLNNIGSVFRTCDAFAVEKLFLCGITACPPHRDIQRTALGATGTVAWEYFENTAQAVEKLKNEGVRVYAVEQVQGSVSLDDFEVEKGVRYALVLGNEVFGVAQDVVDMCHGALEVPQEGTKHSLNVAVCAGVVTWDLFMKMRRLG